MRFPIFVLNDCEFDLTSHVIQAGIVYGGGKMSRLTNNALKVKYEYSQSITFQVIHAFIEDFGRR